MILQTSQLESVILYKDVRHHQQNDGAANFKIKQNDR